MFSRSQRRPPSYSDSFVFLAQNQSLNGDLGPYPPRISSYPGHLFDVDAQDPLLVPPPPSTKTIPIEEGHGPVAAAPLAPSTALFPPPFRRNQSDAQFSAFSIPSGFSPTEKWTTRFLGFGVHLSLVSLFETLFFFLFISKSEDDGLQHMIDNYVNGILSSCGTWSPNTTLVINDVLTLLINRTQTLVAASQASTQRAAFNHTLFVQAWMYVAGLMGLVILGTTAAKCRGMRIAWRRVLLENLIMVSLLGLYELTFFKTIIYNYENISLPELDGTIVTQLHSQCGLLNRPF